MQIYRFIIQIRGKLTQSFRRDPAPVHGIGDPVVVLEGVHGLQYGGHPPDRPENVGVGEEFSGQV